MPPSKTTEDAVEDLRRSIRAISMMPEAKPFWEWMEQHADRLSYVAGRTPEEVANRDGTRVLALQVLIFAGKRKPPIEVS